MELVSLTCPECGSTLEIENGLDTFYCKYCGAKIRMNGMSDAAYKANVRLKEFEHIERLRDKDIEQERIKIAHQGKADKRKLIQSVFNGDFGLYLMLIIMIGGFILFGLFSYGSHHAKVSKLEKVEALMFQAIQNEDYDAALLYANQLHMGDNWSNESTEEWDTKRKEYLTMITEKKEESERANPDNIFMPFGGSYYRNKSADDVIKLLNDLGFTNVTSRPSTRKPGFFHSEYDIESFLFDGKSDFKKNDFFNKNIPIVLYYYSN